MSLLKFLSAGKSLDGLKDCTARYRMRHPGSMPKFGSGKNPFQAKSERLQAAASRPAESCQQVDSPTAPAVNPAEPKETASVAPAVTPAPTVSAGKHKPSRSLLSGILVSIRSVLRKPWSKAPRPPRRPVARPPVQAELSLDCVKVLRNDLSDADLEVVAARAESIQAAAKIETATEAGLGNAEEPLRSRRLPGRPDEANKGPTAVFCASKQ